MKGLFQGSVGAQGKVFVGAARFPTLLTTVLLGVVLNVPAVAYEEYSTNGSTGNCASCHGDFRAGGYVSRNDQVAWGRSLHDGHRNQMLSGDCGACHFGGPGSPVFLGMSDGGIGFPAIGCSGCHGRAEPGAGGAVRSSGLRQHHDRNGVQVCRNCHADVNPAIFSPVGENVSPPYYFTPDPAHASKPKNPCNADGSESLVAPPLGLDNDGDNVYDGSDTNCIPAGAEDPEVAPTFAVHGLLPNPSRGSLRVALTLRSTEPALLEILDVSGRLVASREVGSLGAGYHIVELADRRLASGWYLLRLTQEGRMVVAKAIVTN